jgi:cell division initiation protein
MHITPLDIRKQNFRLKFKGFDPDEVSSFLKQVADEFEEIIRENNDFAVQVKTLESKIGHYTKIEKVLNDTLITAQKATDEARVNAQKEAELIIKDAMIRADRYEFDARSRVHQFEAEIIELRNQRDSFLARFRAMLTTQLKLLEVIGGDLKHQQTRSDDQALELTEDETLDEVPPQPNMSSLNS